MKKLIALLLCLPTLAFAAVEIKSGAGTPTATVDSAYGALRVSVHPRSKDCYAVAYKTGVVPVTQAANSAIFAMRISPSGGKSAYIYKVGVDYTTQVAYTSALSATRALVIRRGSGAAAGGGTSLDTFIHRKDPSGSTSQCLNAAGGDVRIGGAGILTVTGLTWETSYLAYIDIGATAVGTAGGTKSYIWTPGEDINSHAIELDPGQVLGVTVGPNAMDAAGTWTAAVSVEWCEY
jgi:hypothetical protein